MLLFGGGGAKVLTIPRSSLVPDAQLMVVPCLRLRNDAWLILADYQYPESRKNMYWVWYITFPHQYIEISPSYHVSQLVNRPDSSFGLDLRTCFGGTFLGSSPRSFRFGATSDLPWT